MIASRGWINYRGMNYISKPGRLDMQFPAEINSMTKSMTVLTLREILQGGLSMPRVSQITTLGGKSRGITKQSRR